jgi:isoquinoline 1-oxidoreductase beta subunit
LHRVRRSGAPWPAEPDIWRFGAGSFRIGPARCRAAWPAPCRKPRASAIGQHAAFPRLDLPAKLDGGWMFAGDVRLPDMVFAAIRHAPVGEAAHLAGHDARAAKGIGGFLKLVEGPDWLAAVATNSWAAEQALAAVAPRFSVHRPISAERSMARWMRH